MINVFYQTFIFELVTATIFLHVSPVMQTPQTCSLVHGRLVLARLHNPLTLVVGDILATPPKYLTASDNTRKRYSILAFSRTITQLSTEDCNRKSGTSLHQKWQQSYIRIGNNSTAQQALLTRLLCT